MFGLLITEAIGHCRANSSVPVQWVAPRLLKCGMCLRNTTTLAAQSGVLNSKGAIHLSRATDLNLCRIDSPVMFAAKATVYNLM